MVHWVRSIGVSSRRKQGFHILESFPFVLHFMNIFFRSGPIFGDLLPNFNAPWFGLMGKKMPNLNFITGLMIVYVFI
jgi:hypothetical protein